MILLTFVEPKRGRMDVDQIGPAKLPLITSFRYIIRTPTYWFAVGADVMRAVGANALAAFTSVFFLRIHGFSQKNQAMFLTWILPLGGIIGVIITMTGGTAWLYKRAVRAHSLLCIACMALIGVLGITSILVDNVYTSMVLMGCVTFCVVLWNGGIFFSFC
jgi:hypothetical protein